MVLERTKRIRIVYLYHPDDESFFTQLYYENMVGLLRDGSIDDCPEFLAGTDHQAQTKLMLEQAQVIILLFSTKFNANEHYSSLDMKETIRQCFEKGTRVWPIIVKPVSWPITIFREYEVFFGEDKAITEYTPHDGAYKKIIEKITWEITKMLSEEWEQDGNMHYRQMNLDDALSAYEYSLHYKPDHFPALLGKGRTLRKQHRLEDAKQCFETVVSHGAQEPNKKRNVTTQPPTERGGWEYP